MSTTDLLSALRAGHDLATLLGDHGIPVSTVSATASGALDVFLAQDEDAARSALDALGLPVTAERHYPDGKRPFSTATTDFRGRRACLFGRLDEPSATVEDADTGEVLTDPMPLRLAQRLVESETSRRVQVAEVAR